MDLLKMPRSPKDMEITFSASLYIHRYIQTFAYLLSDFNTFSVNDFYSQILVHNSQQVCSLIISLRFISVKEKSTTFTSLCYP